MYGVRLEYLDTETTKEEQLGHSEGSSPPFSDPAGLSY